MTDKPKPLTPKQEQFCRKYVECSNASEAYRHAYDVGKDTKPETVWRKACEVMANGKVSARVYELQEAAAERTLVTVESLMLELEEARKLAKDTAQPAAMNGSTMGKAKLAGLLVEKKETSGELKIVMAKDVDDL